jgi:hypothetical protein
LHINSQDGSALFRFLNLELNFIFDHCQD